MLRLGSTGGEHAPVDGVPPPGVPPPTAPPPTLPPPAIPSLVPLGSLAQSGSARSTSPLPSLSLPSEHWGETPCTLSVGTTLSWNRCRAGWFKLVSSGLMICMIRKE